MELIAATLFSLLLVLFSYRVNRRLSGEHFKVDPYRLSLTATAVLLLAVIAESLVNPAYEFWMGRKLWEYQAFPLHDRNVSALAILVWVAYGIHLYFTQQTMERRLPNYWKSRFGQSLIIGFEAPFFFEVSGNLVFLVIARQYYAYYLPAEVAHLTSVQVVPVYMLCIFVGLAILKWLHKLPKHKALPPALFTLAVIYLMGG